MRRPTWAPSPSLWILAVLCSVAILLLALPGLAAPQEKAPPPSRPEAKSSQVVSGCAVQVTGGKRGTDVASAWETCSGGSLNIEVADSSTGSDQHHTTTPGHKYIDTLTLRGPLAGAQWGASDSYEVLENGAGKFAIEIDGAPLSSANVESITMEDLVIDEREMTTGVDWDYRVYGPGDAHYGSISSGPGRVKAPSCLTGGLRPPKARLAVKTSQSLRSSATAVRPVATITLSVFRSSICRIA